MESMVVMTVDTTMVDMEVTTTVAAMDVDVAGMAAVVVDVITMEVAGVAALLQRQPYINKLMRSKPTIDLRNVIEPYMYLQTVSVYL